MEQLGLAIDPPKPRARRRDPSTSHAAAKRAAGSAATHRDRIMAALDAGKGSIYDIGARCGLSHVEVARRLPELKAMNLAEPTGEIATDGCRLWRKVQR